IPAIRAAVAIPVVANGEIWTVADAQRCREVSGGQALMLGRGIVADPGLALAIRAADEGGGPPHGEALPWTALLPHIADFWQLVCEDLEPRQRAGRLKQWLNLLRRRYPEAEAAYQHVRTMTDQQAITQWVAQQLRAA
ncbi:tRNA-dihydrouridine synthase, partial [Xanthomonas citri pv. citri]